MNIKLINTISELDFTTMCVKVSTTSEVNNFEELRVLTKKNQSLHPVVVANLLSIEMVKTTGLKPEVTSKYIIGLATQAANDPIAELQLVKIIALSIDRAYPDNIKDVEKVFMWHGNFKSSAVNNYRTGSTKPVKHTSYDIFPLFRTEEQLKFAICSVRKLIKMVNEKPEK